MKALKKCSLKLKFRKNKFFKENNFTTSTSKPSKVREEKI